MIDAGFPAGSEYLWDFYYTHLWDYTKGEASSGVTHGSASSAMERDGKVSSATSASCDRVPAAVPTEDCAAAPREVVRVSLPALSRALASPAGMLVESEERVSDEAA